MNTINTNYSPTTLDHYNDVSGKSINGDKVGHNATPVFDPGMFPDRLPGVDVDDTLTAPVPPKDLQAAVDSMSRALVLVTAQQATTDLYALMQLIAQTAQEQRNSSRELREADYRVQSELQVAAAAQIREGAQERLIGAIVGGAFQIAGALVSLKYAKFDEKSPEAHKGSAIAQTLGGVGKFGQEVLNSAAGESEAHRAELDAAATRRGQMGNEANETMDQMLQMVRDALEKLRSIESSRQDTARGIARNV
ncbi:type III secretion system translocon subunit SctB [Bordetella sp. 02P26C-1]|uniref:type III secretion system translocon subunit SctB n=1 Tax=Bordetella sp. 02P26C-1 TaxID=2683195 RepID=UPI0013545B33|nr:type III secretion system translocon subunit SctB [Bordetella sp. 02P26C-1]MVW78576.1 hypothetical protein [Bordetella sp. 02P26C-1]